MSESLRHPAHEWEFHPLVRHLVERLQPRGRMKVTDSLF